MLTEIERYVFESAPLVDQLMQHTTEWVLDVWVFSEVPGGGGAATEFAVSVGDDDELGKFTSWTMTNEEEDYVAGHTSVAAALKHVARSIAAKLDQDANSVRFGMTLFDYRAKRCVVPKIDTAARTVDDAELLAKLKLGAADLLCSILRQNLPAKIVALVTGMNDVVQKATGVHGTLAALGSLLGWAKERCVPL